MRTSDQGAFLDGQTGNTNDDILLHKDQQTSPVAIGDEVEVFFKKVGGSMKLLEERILKDGKCFRWEYPQGGLLFDPPSGF